MSIRPRHHLRELLKVLKGLEGWRGAESGLDWNNLDSSGRELVDTMTSLSRGGQVFVESLKRCQELDAEVAAENGLPLTWEMQVEDRFTHHFSVQLHLFVLGKLEKLSWDCLSVIWDLTANPNAVSRARECYFKFFRGISHLISQETKIKLAEKLSSCDDVLKHTPGYDEAYTKFVGIGNSN